MVRFFMGLSVDPCLKKTGNILNRKVFFEVMLCLLLSMISIYEGLNLVVHRDVAATYYGIGPGFYLLIVSLILMGGSVVYFFINRKKSQGEEKTVISREMRMKLITTIANCAIYVLLINILGYLVSTLLFFFLQFRIEGIKSWLRNLVLTFIISLTYYLVFVKYCSLIFPRGILRIGLGL